MFKMLLRLLLITFLLLYCSKNDSKTVANLIHTTILENPVIEPGFSYADSRFSNNIPNWYNIRHLNISELKIASLKSIEYSSNPSILWEKSDYNENLFYFVPDSLSDIEPVKFELCKWNDSDVFNGQVNIELNYSDTLGTLSKISFPFKLRIIPSQNRLDYWPIDFRMGEIESNNKTSKIALVHSSPFGLIYNKKNTEILCDQNNDGIFVNSPYFDTVSTFHNSEIFELDKPLLINGSAYIMSDLSIDGSCLTLIQIKEKVALNVGFEIPEFKVLSLEGDTIDTKSFKNKIVVLSWWGPGCMGFTMQRPGFNQLVEKYKDKNDILFLAIAYTTKEYLLKYLEENPFNFKMSFWNKETEAIFGEGTPRTVVLDKNKKIISNLLGGSPETHKVIGAVIQNAL